MHKIYRRIRKYISDKRRKFLNIYELRNNFSIISCNCLGGLIYHDLNMQFLSPTINLFINTPDFVKFCNNIEYYIACELVEHKDDRDYPIGMLDDIQIDFLHYKDFNEAKTCWNKRKKRINYNNIFVIISDRDNYSDDLLSEIDKIKYPKVLFSHKKIARDYCVYVRKDKNKKMVGPLMDYIDFKGHKKYEYYFDICKWLTGKYSVNECVLR